MAWLIKALDIDGKGLKTVEEYEKQFDQIAEILINQCCLQINNRPHRFVEIEFYYTDATHADPFTHQDKDQQQCAKWYFHKIGSQYKGGTYKGLDITCGSPNIPPKIFELSAVYIQLTSNKKSYGGILIRGIQDLDTGEIKDGSCMCVDHILQLNETDSIKEFTTLKKFLFEVTQGTALCIVRKSDLPKVDVVKSARVGLNMKKSSPNQTEFVMKPYRYLAFPTLTKKGKIHVALTLYMQGKTPAQIQKITGSPLSSINNWIALYKKGEDTKITAYVNMALDNESLCKALGAWAKRYYGPGSNPVTTAPSANNEKKEEVVIVKSVEELLNIKKHLQQNVPQFRAMLPQLRMRLNSYQTDDVLQAVVTFRKFLSLDVNVAPIDDVYEAGIVPKFAEFLHRAESPDLLVEAAWALTNIACSPKFEHIQAIFDADVIPQLIRLLSSSNQTVYDQVLWLIANLIGHVDNEENEKKVMHYRKKFIELGVIPQLCLLGQAEQPPAVASNVAWVFDNLLRGAEFVPQSQALATLPVLAKLTKVPDREVASYSAMAVARLTEKHDETVLQRTFDTNGLIDILIDLLGSEDKVTKYNACKALVNLSAGTPEQVNELINRELLGKLLTAISDHTPSKHFIKISAKLLEHVTLAADEELLGLIINHGVFTIGLTVPNIAKEPDYIWAISNATFAANEQQIQFLIAQDLQKQLGAALIADQTSADTDYLVAILEGLNNFLTRGPNTTKNTLTAAVKQCFKSLTTHEDKTVQTLAVNLVNLVH